MGRLSEYAKQRIVILHSQKFTFVDIVKLLKEEGIHTTRLTVSKYMRSLENPQPPRDIPERKRKLTLEYLNFLDREMEKNDELCAPDARKLLHHQFGIDVSISTIKLARKRLGWIKSGVKYCQLVREKNRVERLQFSLTCQEVKEDFIDVVFTDESSIWLERHGKVCFRRVNEQAKMKPTVKHPLKVHVWAGISTRGATKMAIFTGIMRKEFYVDTILAKYLKPYLDDLFPDNNYRFMQDNDPKHKSKYAMKYIDSTKIRYWPTPAESPDLNPIEMLWHELKHSLRKYVKPRNQEELVNGIKQFWATVTVEKCQKYIGHLQKVIPIVIAREGKASGH